MDIKLASEVQHDSIVDGQGFRSVIWCQGCEHQCLNCHNKSTWDINKGISYDVKEIIQELLNECWYKAITFSGGDPFVQSEACCEIAKELKKNNFNIWCYTGYLFEDIKDNEFLKYIDVLVDGKFINELKSYELMYKGSTNQRIINVQKSLIEKKIYLKDF